MDYALLVFDIGMTNKKVAVYDEKLKPLDLSSKSFAPLRYQGDGLELDAHDIEGIKAFFLAELARFAARYPIRAIAVTTHGATFVCLDKDGNVCAPCVLYTHEPGEAFHQAFYARAGGKDELQQTTHTPPLSSMINAAKGIFFLRRALPGHFAKTRAILAYPSYWAFVLSGVYGAEPTSVGCHTYLWDHARTAYSPVADRLGIRALLPGNYRPSYAALGTITPEIARATGLDRRTVVTMGIHDSNASLLPYLATERAGGFTLNSTGTWCVLMHPETALTYAPGDIGNIVFYNQSALGDPVKTAIFLGGLELDAYVTLYKKLNHTAAFPPYNPAAFNALHAENDTHLLPEIVRGSGQFTRTRAGIHEKGRFYPFAAISEDNAPAIMRQSERFWALLDSSLVIQTLTALDRAGRKDGERVFTEGGFRQNRGYNALLAAALPRNRCFLTNLDEATSFGAAMTAAMAYSGTNEVDPALVHIAYRPCETPPFPHFEAYRATWLSLAARFV